MAGTQLNGGLEFGSDDFSFQLGDFLDEPQGEFS